MVRTSRSLNVRVHVDALIRYSSPMETIWTY